MGFNVGMAFTANGAAPVIVHDGKPSHYDFGFQTSDGIPLSVRVETDNEARAETIRSDLEERMDWTSIPVNEPATNMSILGEAVGAAFLFPLMLFCAMIVGGVVYGAADFAVPEQFSRHGSYISFATRVSLYSVPFFFVVMLIAGFVSKNTKK
jgi:hypothetical protein